MNVRTQLWKLSIFASILALLLTGTLRAPAQAAPLAAPGVILAVDKTARTNLPGSLLTYTLTLTNTGDAADTFGLTLSSTEWGAGLSQTSLSLEAGAAGNATASVTIPENAVDGASQSFKVTAVSGLDGSVSASVTFSASARIPTPTPPAAVSRPLLVITGYGSSVNPIPAGKDFDLEVTLKNKGQAQASNIVVAFESPDFLPRDTGGVRTLNRLNAGNSADLSQPFLANAELAGKTVSTLTVKITYSDASGATYTETFTLTLDLKNPVSSGSGAAQPTATPTGVARAQIVVSSYASDVDPLQPGTVFNLNLEIHNLGTADARAVTLVLGGSSIPNPGDGSSTPQPGGVSGGSSDLTNFAPLGSSNLFYVGDIAAGQVVKGSQQLIVNVTTQPGAYPLKLSFVYNDSKNNQIVDDQVVTLLVYSLPQVEVNFYRDPGVFFTNQPNMLPLQITNLGKKTTVLGNMRISAEGAEVTNNVSLVGALDPGGYFTLDSMVIPSQAGPLDLSVTINYTDDFNQPRVITQTVQVAVEEAPVMEPMPGEGGMLGPDGLPISPEGFPTTEETFWQKVLRFFKGLLGLGSDPAQPDMNVPMEGPMEGPMEENFDKQQPARPSKGGYTPGLNGWVG